MKTVLITGINRGLGKALFNCFASAGHFVYGVVRNEAEVNGLANQFPNNSEIILADLASDKSIQAIQDVVNAKSIDLLINNAGIAGNAHLIETSTSTEINDLFNVHCLGAFRTVKALQHNLMSVDQPIVLNLNSRLGSITRQSNSTYSGLNISYSYRIAKAAQNMLTNCLRQEFKGKIQFISIHPGRMKTDIASTDADVEPTEIANRILRFYQERKLNEENGIIELEKEVIEW